MITTIASYDDLLNPLVTEESANGATRTTTNTYRVNGRPATTTVTTSGLTGSSPSTTGIGKTTIGYDPATGLQTTVTTDAAGGNPGGVVTTGYDSWGRQTTYTITNNGSSAETTTTAYNVDGDVGSVTDPKGTTTYTYDGTDAAGKEEHRSLATKVSVSRDTGGALDFTGAYDSSGALVRQNLPGGLIQRVGYDAAGEPTGLSYSGPIAITDPATGDVTGTDPDGAWVGWSQDNDAQGRVRREWTPTGGGLTGDLSGAAATGFARDYTYDRAARLVSVKDQTLPAAGGTTLAGDAGVTGIASAVCQVRDYAFDTNGNRTTKTVTTGAAGNACPTFGGTTKTWTYDNGDRITTSGYVYDQLGRQTSIPQVDTPAAAAGGNPGAMSLGYYNPGHRSGDHDHQALLRRRGQPELGLHRHRHRNPVHRAVRRRPRRRPRPHHHQRWQHPDQQPGPGRPAQRHRHHRRPPHQRQPCGTRVLVRQRRVRQQPRRLDHRQDPHKPRRPGRRARVRVARRKATRHQFDRHGADGCPGL